MEGTEQNPGLQDVRSISARAGRIGVGFVARDKRSAIDADVSTVAARDALTLPTGFRLLKHRKRGGVTLACGKLGAETLEEYEVVK